MTKEVDCLIAIHAAAGAPGEVTDIATPGCHGPMSWHYVIMDGRTSIRVTPSSTPGGTAVDFGGAHGPLNTADSLAVYRTFEPFGRAGQLAELYCAQADWCVYQGRFMLWIDVPARAGRILRPQHQNHIHVAVRPGVFLIPPSHPTAPEEDAMATRYITVPCPTGGYWLLQRDDGGVANFHGAPFFGAMPGKARVVAPLIGLTPCVQGGAIIGYWIYDADGHVYSYGAAPHYAGYADHPEWQSAKRRIVGLVQSGGWNPGEVVRYAQLGEEDGDAPFHVDEYALPA